MILITILVVNATSTTNSYLKEIKVCSSSITKLSTEDGKYYIQVSSVMDGTPVNISDDDLWIEVNSTFYFNHRLLDKVGVLLGHYDIYKKNIFMKGMALDKEAWSVDEVYDSLEDAQSANPYREYTDTASIEKKKAFKSGNYYFVLKSGERTFNLQVDKDIFEKYKDKQSIDCEFEGYGDFIRLTGIAE